MENYFFNQKKAIGQLTNGFSILKSF